MIDWFFSQLGYVRGDDFMALYRENKKLRRALKRARRNDYRDPETGRYAKRPDHGV